MASLIRCITTVPTAAVLSFLIVTSVLAEVSEELEARFMIPPVVRASADAFTTFAVVTEFANISTTFASILPALISRAI